MRAPLSSAMTDLYARVLNWRVEEPYQLLNSRVNSRWDWGGGARHARDRQRSARTCWPPIRACAC